MAIVIDEEICTGCAQCVMFCPEEALTAFWGKSEVDIKKCTDCLSCIYCCPNFAIKEGS
jgi:Pyruvate/2-oxoacid:ferredoxin oxidoreductase delta subunit